MQKQATLIGLLNRNRQAGLPEMYRTLHRRILHFCCVTLLVLILLASLLWITGAHIIPATPGIPNQGLEDGIPTYFYDSTDLSTLKLAQVIFRHGARTPLYTFPTDPNKDFDYGGVQGSAQLISKGRKQAYAFGKYLRKRYDGYLASAYSYDQVYAQSSDTDRTIMTGQNCLQGLFPMSSGIGEVSGVDWQSIPIHSLPNRIDNKIGFAHPCKLHEKLLKEYMESPAIKEFDKGNEWIYNLVSQNSGLKITDFRQLEKLANTLMVEKQNGLVLPDWAEKIYDQTMPSFRLDLTTKSATPQMQRLLISPLVMEMVRNMDLQISRTLPTGDLSDYHNRSAKVYLYSGHDSTLSAFLNSFNLYDGEPPTYVSAIIIELHQSDSNSPELNHIENNEDDHHIIKVFYKYEVEEPIRELILPKCPNPCLISVFKTKYSEFLMDHTQWRTECSE